MSEKGGFLRLEAVASGRLSSERHLGGFSTSGAASLRIGTAMPEHPCGDGGGISLDMGSGIGHPRVGKMNSDVIRGKGETASWDRGREKPEAR